MILILPFEWPQGLGLVDMAPEPFWIKIKIRSMSRSE
jgi:hypothetical protein